MRELPVGAMVKITAQLRQTGFNTGLLVPQVDRNSGITRQTEFSHDDRVGIIIGVADRISGFLYYDVELLNGDIVRYVPDSQLTLLENV